MQTRTDDWEEFRTLDGCARKAGVARQDLPALVAKELVDNALDAGATCEATVDGFRIVVSDDGPGFAESDEDLAELFSVGRPMVSTKRLRRVTRGALGNGLRVVAGAVLASDGRLWVTTRGRRLRVVPQHDGTSTVVEATDSRQAGTRIEVELGGALALAVRDEERTLRWARQALALAPAGALRECRSSPWWYASDAFHALLQAAGDRTVRELVGMLDGCSGAKAADIAGEHRGRRADALALAEAEDVLGRARDLACPVKPARLCAVGKDALGGDLVHARNSGEFRMAAGRGRLEARIPFLVECWARAAEDESVAVVAVNRTPVVAEVSARCQDWVGGKKTFTVQGCGVELHVERAGRNPLFEAWINVQCPVLAFTTDGKAPDLAPLQAELQAALSKAVRKARRLRPRVASAAAADVIAAALRLWEDEWKPQGIVPTLRQVFYVLAVAEVVSKDDAGYAQVGKALARGREEGAYPWAGIADPLREVRRVPTWSSVEEFLVEKRDEYRLDKWLTQPRRVELWTEKDALTGALQPLAVELEVPLLVARGYASATAKHDAAERLRDGKPVTILYVGDFDPSGVDMFEGMERWIRTHARASEHVTFRRLAVTEEDLRSGTHPTLAVNRRDARAASFRERFGDEVIEAEALRPAELRRRVREAVLSCRDEAPWQEELERETAHRAELARRLAGPGPGRGRKGPR